jgi:hypothetical protein
MRTRNLCGRHAITIALLTTLAACEQIGNIGQRTTPAVSSAAGLPLLQPAQISQTSFYGPPNGWSPGNASPTPARWMPPPTPSATPPATPPEPPPPPLAVVPNASVFASAPPTITTADLGRPCDGKFHLLRGEGGAPLYAKQQGIAAGSSGMAAQFLEAHDSRELGANAEGWGLGAGMGDRTDRRYLVYRASQQSDILQVNDAAAWSHAPPAEAMWYVASIFVGRSYEVVVSGSQQRFTSGIKAKLLMFNFDLSKSTLGEGIEWSAKGRGLQARKENDRAIFAQSPDEIRRAYRESDNPVPIFIEYRNIPGKLVAVPEHLEWAAAPVPDDVKVGKDSLSCACISGHRIAMTCPVRNHGGRSMDVTVKAHAMTGTTGHHAEGVARVRVAAQTTTDVRIDAPIANAWFDCDSAVHCECSQAAANPTLP